MEALLWDLVHSSQWAGYSQVSHIPLLASGLGSCRQLPFKLTLFLETDFKLLNMHHLSLRVVYNFKCFLQSASLAGNYLPSKMFLISTPLLGHFGLWFPSVFSRVQRKLETMFGCNTGLIKARKVHCHFTEIFWLYFSYCLNVAVMCVYASVSLHRHFCQNIKTLLFYDTLAYKPYSKRVFIFSLCKENFVSSWSKSFVLYCRQLLSFLYLD